MESYAACVHLDWLNDYDVWCDDRHISSRAISTGAIHISDMRHAWRADVRSPFHVVNFYIPQAELDEFADDQGAPRIEELKCPIDLGHIDPVLCNLARALLPSLARPDHTNRLFAEYASRAVTAHLVKSYGSLPLTPRNSQGGLAPWQERRAKGNTDSQPDGQYRFVRIGKCLSSIAKSLQSRLQENGWASTTSVASFTASGSSEATSSQYKSAPV